ncbi:IS66 family insertion sequence element accessory protein TnpB [uncultured Bacteroides sp.]
MEVFVFLSRDRKLLKILRWNDGTFVLYTVKLYNRKRVNPSYHTESESYKMNWNDFWNLISNRKNCLNGLEKGE